MPVVIKRYLNRKLYNTKASRYITLDEIADLIRDEQEVQVIDNSSGEDITAVTLSQIIFEAEKNQTGFLPRKLLVSMVQSGGSRMDVIRQNLFSSLTLTHHFDVEIEKRINILVEREVLTPDAGSQLLERLLEAGKYSSDTRMGLETRLIDIIRGRQIPSRNEIKTLIHKVDAMAQQVDKYYENGKSEVY